MLAIIANVVFPLFIESYCIVTLDSNSTILKPNVVFVFVFVYILFDCLFLFVKLLFDQVVLWKISNES